MKKTLLFAGLLSVSMVVFGQIKHGIEHLSQNFSSGFPPTGWTIDVQPGNWSAVQSANAGGTAPEVRFSWTPNFNNTSRLISPVVDVSGVSNLVLEFKHAIDHYSGAYTVGAATRSNGGAWNIVWSRTGIDIVETVSVPIQNADLGSSTFQFCLYFAGNSYNIDYWYIDDVVLFTPFALDLAANSINMNPYVNQGSYGVSATVKNVGINPISSFNIQYQIADGDIIAESVTGLTLNSGQSYTHTFNQQWTATPGPHHITVTNSNINGLGNDNDPSNNTITKTINVASQVVPNLPLFESFTSSTCGPCYTFNTGTFTPFLNSHAGEFAIIKYQMSWPTPGDPYYTAEGGVRRYYYGVSAVPMLFTGGEPTATNTTALNNAFDAQHQKDAFFSINAHAYFEGNNVHAKIQVMPYISAAGFKVHAAIVENLTTGNIMNNGETSFKWVMMKMLPDANGTTVNFVDGQFLGLNFEQDMSGTHVEEMNDLSLVVFIQNDETKEVFQSKMVPCGNTPRTDPIITSFDFVGVDEISVEIGDYVNDYATINVTVAHGTDVTTLTPTLTISEGATITPAPPYGPMDFSDPVEFVLTDAYNFFYNYTVIVEEPRYIVTFNVTNQETGNPIEGAVISVDSETLITDVNGTATVNLLNNDYTYTVTYENFGTITGTFTVDGQNISVDVEMVQNEFNVTFSVSNADLAPISNAVITIEGIEQTLTTNTSGVASLFMLNGEYNFSVSASNYFMYEGSFTVSGEDIALEIEMVVEEYIITFSVKDATFNEALEGAIISINSQLITTGSNGEATITLQNGAYPFTVIMVGYDNFVGNVTVAGSDQVVNVPLVVTGIDVDNMLSLNIYPNPSKGDFTIEIPNAKDVAQIRIYNITGTLVFSTNSNLDNNKINLNINQPQGVYMVNISLKNGDILTGKLIVR
jgi:hypothetical protein